MNKILNSMNPLNVLDRGFSVVSDEKGNLLTSIENLKETKNIELGMRDGKAQGKFEFLK